MLRAAQIAVPFGYYDANGKRYARVPGQKSWQWPLPTTLTITDAFGDGVTTNILDGDPSDARFDDAQSAPGSIAGLRFKEILAKGEGGTMGDYSRKFVDPSVKRGFILKAPVGKPHIVIGVDSGGQQQAFTDAEFNRVAAAG